LASKLPWLTMFSIAGILIAAAIIGPSLYVPSSISESGPHIFNAQNPPYWVDTFAIPPVRAGTVIHIVASEHGPGNVTIVLESEKYPGQPLPNVISYYLTNKTSSIDVKVPLEESSIYDVYVISYHATYTIQISGVWAEFYSAELGLYWGIVAAIAGTAMYFYYRGSKSRDQIYEQTLAEIRKKEEEKRKASNK